VIFTRIIIKSSLKKLRFYGKPLNQKSLLRYFARQFLFLKKYFAKPSRINFLKKGSFHPKAVRISVNIVNTGDFCPDHVIFGKLQALYWVPNLCKVNADFLLDPICSELYREPDSRFSTSGFFHQTTPPRVPIHGLKPFWIWLLNSRRKSTLKSPIFVNAKAVTKKRSLLNAHIFCVKVIKIV
jgi:hypothetical protein